MATIQCTNITRSYQVRGVTYHALHEISLDIKPGSFVAVTGPSGSGKSTLLNLIGGLDRPSSGELLVNAQNLPMLSDKKLAGYRKETLGFVFQSFNLLPHLTAWDNVHLSLQLLGDTTPHSRQLAREALISVGLEERLYNIPSELSGGEQQRVGIARALVKQPDLILADEPTGNLDTQNGHEILHLLKKSVKSGKTLIMVTHDPILAAQADYTITMQDGHIV